MRSLKNKSVAKLWIITGIYGGEARNEESARIQDVTLCDEDSSFYD